jgi:hypothetical protein
MKDMTKVEREIEKMRNELRGRQIEASELMSRVGEVQAQARVLEDVIARISIAAREDAEGKEAEKGAMEKLVESYTAAEAEARKIKP